MDCHLILLLVCIVAGFNQTQSSNILLIIEILSPSHHHWHRSVTAELVSRGHNVTVVSPFLDVSSENRTYIHMDKIYDSLFNSMDGENFNFIEYGDMSLYLQFITLPFYIDLMCKGFLDSNGFIELDSYPNNFEFDLIIHDFITGGCMLSYFSEKFNRPPLLLMTAYNDYSQISSITKTEITSAISSYIMLREEPNSFLSRVENYVLHMLDNALWECYLYSRLDRVVAQRYKNIPPMIEVKRRAALVLFNYDPVVDGIKQLPPNVIGVGGLQIQKPKELPPELKAIANNAIGGLIVFSMGTNVRSEYLGNERINQILDAFRQFQDYTFLWKFESEKHPIILPENVFIRKWIPQNDVLAHRNTKLFITHGGLLSTQESIYYGVPMLGIPVAVDQYDNINRSIRKGIAEKLLIKELTTDNLVKKLSLLLTDPKYERNMKTYAIMFRDQKETPMERALFWIEWVLRNPEARHFESNRSALNFLQIQSIDVIVFLTVCLLIYLYVTFKLILKLFKWMISSKSKKI